MFKNLLDKFKLFFKGAFVDSSTDKLEVKARNINDNLLTVVLSERLGIPNPMYYYTIEILPYIAKDLKGWNRRMAEKKSIISSAIGEIGEP
ncbi:hypothetical protein Dester_1023 [Desulfurobacterium thermolithotrophum DSM 11699]|uniref:Uncharacterized protein n=1 Tax=Desulfurobacterium thermolithotrophum (strain DSM 11699 / BSA) TaxID=868864 RepID=F0S489_DESTD|nr:hypothetical protein [Desulfurobacterium thermolithotrophum]ADY73661.1 hypothetical protein Dester_1023 [Desulfurobacterium thermolithotrophum DSM 11699]